ncbi:hypothetical protein U1Q18_025192 [Sarracenia purpurea var. burkii]
MGGPKNNNSLGCMDPQHKESGAHPIFLPINASEASIKDNHLPQQNTEPKAAEETSKTSYGKLPRAGRWKKLARGDKRGTRFFELVAGTKRNVENDVMKAGNAKVFLVERDGSSVGLELLWRDCSISMGSYLVGHIGEWNDWFLWQPDSCKKEVLEATNEKAQ